MIFEDVIFWLHIVVFSMISNGQYSYTWSKEQKIIEIQNIRWITRYSLGFWGHGILYDIIR